MLNSYELVATSVTEFLGRAKASVVALRLYSRALQSMEALS